MHQVRGWFSGVELKLSRRQRGPSRTGDNATISELIRAERATLKTSQPAAAPTLVGIADRPKIMMQLGQIRGK